MLSLDSLYAEEMPARIENSFNMEYPESLNAKIYPCLDRSDFPTRPHVVDRYRALL